MIPGARGRIFYSFIEILTEHWGKKGWCRIKRPDFDQFRSLFLSCLTDIAGGEPETLAKTGWHEIGSLEERRRMLALVAGRTKENFGIGFEINSRLLNVEGSVESAVIQAYHELNTIWLIERINLKIRARMN
ncbi:MAG TPA: hypothetical protein PK728_07690 [Bacillota bacterium]|nr:hypothetical protein [Bacillota bacterium]